MGGIGFRALDFEASAELASTTIVRFTGNGDSSVTSDLAQMISDVHDQVVARRAATVVVDMHALEFMSASCFNVLVTWLGWINELAPSSRYRVRFATNTTIPWQRRSLRTLSCFATDLVEVEG